LVAQDFSHASDAEGLRLMQAFFHITDPLRRREVIALAEKLAKQSRRVQRRYRRTTSRRDDIADTALIV
jgi:hypothetical protein